MNKIIVTAVSGLMLAGVLSGCVVDSAATNVVTGVGSVVTSVGSLAGSIVLTPVQVRTIQEKASLACSFFPTFEAISKVAASFSTTYATGSSLVTPIVSGICNAVDNASHKQSVSRVIRQSGPDDLITIGQVNGVTIDGYFVRN